MFSNKMYVFLFLFLFFFFKILCFAPLISSKTLSQDYYDGTCSGVEDIVWRGVVNATIYDSRMPASLLRLHFHDCFVNGCDASVLLDGPDGEQGALPNLNSVRGFQVIDNIKAEVEKNCPKKVSCADILTLAARAAVKISLGTTYPEYPNKLWTVALGRQDGMIKNQSGANSDIPSAFASVDTLIKMFAEKGLTVQDMVALSGAHTIGLTKCSSFKSRLYASNSTKIIDADLLKVLRKNCTNIKSSDNNTVPLDWQTPNKFDNNYYINIVNKAGVLTTDQALALDNRTSRWVYKYKDHQQEFLKDFKAAMGRMGNISVIMKGGLIKGEIRKKCGSTNK